MTMASPHRPFAPNSTEGETHVPTVVPTVGGPRLVLDAGGAGHFHGSCQPMAECRRASTPCTLPAAYTRTRRQRKTMGARRRLEDHAAVEQLVFVAGQETFGDATSEPHRF